MGKPSAPAAPDPNATAAAQGQWNSFTAQQQQAMNMVGQDTPWGSLTYDQTGTTTIRDPSGRPIQVPQYTATTSLSPSQQAIFDQTQEAQGNLAGLASDQSARLRELLNSPFEFNNQDAADWSYDLASSRILPQQERAREALDRQLINRGIRPGTEAYMREMERMDQANSDQMNQLALQGRSQAFSEAAYQRSNPINEIGALLSSSQVTQPGQTFASTPQTQVGGVDYSGIVNQNHQTQMSRYNAALGGMGGLFGTLGGGLMQGIGKAGGIAPFFSDRRLKSDIRRIGTIAGEIPLYEYTIFGERQRGVMADEVEKVAPDAVLTHPSGFKMVRYDMLGLV